MGEYWKAVAGVMIGVVLTITLKKQEQDIGVLLAMTICCLVIFAAVTYLKPVLVFLQELGDMADIQEDTLGILMKAVGIALITQIGCAICKDAGNGSQEAALQLLGSAVILSFSVPVYRSFLSLLQEILGLL